MRLPLVFASKPKTETQALVSARSVTAFSVEALREEIARQTLRAMAKIDAVGPQEANEFFHEWMTDKQMAQGDFLESFLLHQRKSQAEMDDIASRLKASEPAHYCDFSSKVSSQSQSSSKERLRSLRDIHCYVLNFYEQGSMEALVIGAFSPVVGSIAAAWLRSSSNSSGSRPYVGYMRLTYAEWKKREAGQ
jgi:hypothetical protein